MQPPTLQFLNVKPPPPSALDVILVSNLGFWGFYGGPPPVEPHLLDVWINPRPLLVRPGGDDPDPEAGVDPLDLGPASAQARLDVQQPLE